jgi:hypothetical protein
MDIRGVLISGHSRALTTSIVRYIGADAKKFKVLTDIFFGGDPRLTQRSAWPMSDIGINEPQLVLPYLAKLLDALDDNEAHPAVPRNILRVLQFVEVPEKHCSRLLDQCFSFIRGGSAPVAVRACAITVASNICNRFPDLRSEFVILLNDISAHPQTPAIRQRVKLALKQPSAAKTRD